MKKKIILTGTLSFLFIIAFAMNAGVDGKWTGFLTLPDGSTKPIDYTFAVQNTTLTGTASGTGGDFDISDGKINGDSLSFSVTVGNGDQITNTGKYYAAGDSISLNLLFMGAMLHATLKRAP